VTTKKTRVITVKKNTSQQLMPMIRMKIASKHTTKEKRINDLF
jgi:hypothetical protein